MLKLEELIEILKVYAGVRGLGNLYKMLNEEMTIEQYLKRVIEGAEEDIAVRKQRLSKAEGLGKVFIQDRINDAEQNKAFALGYLAGKKEKST